MARGGGGLGGVGCQVGAMFRRGRRRGVGSEFLLEGITRRTFLMAGRGLGGFGCQVGSEFPQKWFMGGQLRRS